MFEEFDIPDHLIDQAEASVATQRAVEESQAPIDAGDGCEGGACKI